MKVLNVVVTLLLGVNASDTIDALAAEALSILEARFATAGSADTEVCTNETVAVRREWFVYSNDTIM